MPMSDEQQAGEEHYREVAEKIRELARQTRIAEAREELFDLADWLDRKAELVKRTWEFPSRRATNGPGRQHIRRHSGRCF
jgi:hypothetical protein